MKRKKNERPRHFKADLVDGASLLAAQVDVELWTRNTRSWRGQMLFLAQGDIQVGRQYLLRAERERRDISVVDVTILRGLCWVLFEQVPAPADALVQETNGGIISLPLDIMSGRLLRAAHVTVPTPS
ncbi:MAG: hypothetical protein U0793_22415 [Gemmataceae bacterium]